MQNSHCSYCSSTPHTPATFSLRVHSVRSLRFICQYILMLILGSPFVWPTFKRNGAPRGQPISGAFCGNRNFGVWTISKYGNAHYCQICEISRPIKSCNITDYMLARWTRGWRYIYHFSVSSYNRNESIILYVQDNCERYVYNTGESNGLNSLYQF